MKKTLLLFILCLSCISAFAQDGWFVQPVIGGGIGKVKVTLPFSAYPSTDEPIKFAVLDEVRMDVGYNAGRFIIGSGLGYMRSGFEEDFEYTDANGNPVASGKATGYYNHIVVPVNAGYKFGGKKFSFIPAIGIDFTYNYSLVAITSGYGPKIKTKEPSSEFKSEYRPISEFGMLRLGFDFAVSPRVSIVVIPKADYMLGNIFKNSASYSGELTAHNYTFMLDAGIKWNLSKPEKKAVASDTK